MPCPCHFKDPFDVCAILPGKKQHPLPLPHPSSLSLSPMHTHTPLDAKLALSSFSCLFTPPIFPLSTLLFTCKKVGVIVRLSVERCACVLRAHARRQGTEVMTTARRPDCYFITLGLLLWLISAREVCIPAV